MCGLRPVLLLALFAFSRGVWGQEFSSLYRDLDELDKLLLSQKNYIDKQSATLSELQSKIDLSQNEVKDLKSISQAQGELLNNLWEKTALQEQIRREQLHYQKTLGRELLAWKIGTITFAATTLGLLVWGLMK